MSPPVYALSLALLVTLAPVPCESRGAVTPVEKVLELLDSMIAEVENEGTSEAAAYEKFACFCKDTTTKKSGEIASAKTNIEVHSDNIALKTNEAADLSRQFTESQATYDENAARIKVIDQEMSTAKAEYDASLADLRKAINALEAALKSLQDTASPAALLSVRETISQSLSVARAMNLTGAPKQMAALGFLQAHNGVDPTDAEYKYHSHGIISTLENLLAEFQAKQTALNAEWTERSTAAEGEQKGLRDENNDLHVRIQNTDAGISAAKADAASNRESLVHEEAGLKDMALYLKDLTERCEARAKDWDQRSVMRADELKALNAAVEILGPGDSPEAGTVSQMDQAVNARALLMQKNATGANKKGANATSATHAANRSGAPVAQKALSFLQGASVNSHDHAASAYQAKREKVVQMLQEASSELKSPVLASMLVHVSSDPFEKVKALIQQLIERLLAEGNNEAKKESFCREELGKAEKEREFRIKDAKKLNVDIMGLEAKKAELDQEIADLTISIADLKEELNTSKELRDDDHAANMITISDAKTGLEGITKAIVIIKTFYKQAAKAVALAQASPVDEDLQAQGISDAGLEGNYGGKQDRASGVIGLLEVIKTDFARTITKTKEVEEAEAAEFVEFDRVSRAEIAGKTTKKELDEEDLNTTVNTLELKMEDLRDAMRLLDTALLKLEALKPTCTDFGQSAEDRNKAREQEIEHLQKALCILVPDGVQQEGCSVVPR